MLPRKRYHKVRGACLICKRRKVRCSLERPVCYNCNRLARLCAYSDQTNLQSSVSSPSETGTFQPNSTLEIELMHHYTAFTSLAISNNPTLTALWRDVVPTIAFRHQFLLQGMFAAAAQHKLHGDASTTPELVEAATHYYQEALSTYIHQLHDINEDNCQALFCFSQLIVGLSYSRLILNAHSIIPGMIGILELLRGTLTVAQKASPWLNASVLEPMMNNFPAIIIAQPSATDPRTIALMALSERIASDDSSTSNTRKDDIKILESTIRLVHALLLSDPKSQDAMNKIIGLPVWLDARVASLLKVGDQGALAVLAFYGAALARVDDVWFFADVGRSLVHAVAATVTDSWARHLSWPMRAVGLVDTAP